MPAEISALPQLLPAATDFITDWIDTQRRRSGVPGVQVAIRLGDQLVYSHASGWADQPAGRELTTDQVFRIASHSKTFTATVMMRLVEAGQLRLDDTVATWLPELADAPVGRVTVRELVGHQSGVERDGVDANFWQLNHDFHDRESLIAELRHDLVFEPNTHFHYSNLGFSLLGLIVEAASGRSYHDLGLDLVAELAEYTGESIKLGPELGVGQQVDLVSGHTLPMAEPGEGPSRSEAVRVIAPVNTYAESAATGWWGNAEAATAWLSAHALGTGALLSDASKKLMQRKESEIVEGGVVRHYGLGWVVRSIGDRGVIGHSGGFPGHITQTWGDPETGLSVSVLTNRLGSAASEWATGLVSLVNLVLKHGGAVPAADLDFGEDDSSQASIDTQQYSGQFAALWGTTWLVPLPTVVLALSPEAGDPAGAASVLRPVDQLRLRADAKSGFGSAGELYRLTRDQDGQITSVTSTGITAYPPAVFRQQREQLLTGERLS